jgi:hypothetical protein
MGLVGGVVVGLVWICRCWLWLAKVLVRPLLVGYVGNSMVVSVVCVLV